MAFIRFFSIQQLLRQRFGDAIFSEFREVGGAITRTPTTELVTQVPQKCLNYRGIPLNRVKDSEFVWYVSAIALKLAKSLSSTSTEVAQRLVQSLLQPRSPTDQSLLVRPAAPDIWHDIVLQIVEPGWIQIRLGDQGVARWLNYLVTWDQSGSDRPLLINRRSVNEQAINGYFPEDDSEFFRKSHHIFEIQHIYARCCSLLRLAEENSLIGVNHPLAQRDQQALLSSGMIKDSDVDDVNGAINSTPVILWLDNSTNSLCLLHPAERHLIACLVDVVDLLDLASVESDASPVNGGALAVDQAMANQVLHRVRDLTPAFHQFHQQCRIFGDECRSDPARVNARLGLVWATQTTLAQALHTLCINTPKEL